MDQVFLQQRIYSISRDIRTELIRKSIHLSIAFVPVVAAAIGTGTTLALLAVGTVLYTYAEVQRRNGVAVPIISRMTELASRQRDLNRFVLGPITLGLGAMLALLLYPDPAASIAIYALAFGDGLASVFGKLFGRIRIPATRGKTLEGSIACASAVAIATYGVTRRVDVALFVAVGATALEALPTDDADNLILPVGAGLLAVLIV